MAMLRKCKLVWKAIEEDHVVGYRIYWPSGPTVGYDSNCVDVGRTDEHILSHPSDEEVIAPEVIQGLIAQLEGDDPADGAVEGDLFERQEADHDPPGLTSVPYFKMPP